ncbi:MAG: hypothetical protein HC880_14535, partial [Bacteroidia bacterium]|nr:hypothetical protein [Bacteroidia bacterium]
PGPGIRRDTELAIDTQDVVYLSYRAYDQEAMIGLKKLPADRQAWVDLPNPDRANPGHNNHVYPDLFVDTEGHLHLVQRHGAFREVTYRRSTTAAKAGS